jgi:Big-like domain-containing protein
MFAPSIPKTLRLRLAVVMGAAALAGCLSVDNPFDGVALLTLQSGNEQTVPTGGTAALPLVVRTFDSNSDPIEGAEVQWLVASGSGTVSAATSFTDAAGTAQVNFTAGTTPGTVSVRASSEGLSVNFTLLVVSSP